MMLVVNDDNIRRVNPKIFDTHRGVLWGEVDIAPVLSSNCKVLINVII